MSILELQNINNVRNNSLSPIGKGLGQGHFAPPANETFGGFKYGPKELPAILRTTKTDRTGPRGTEIDYNSADDGSYGPDIGSRLPDANNVGDDSTKSVLGGMATFLASDEPGDWAEMGTRMKTSFTTGSQMASLQNAGVGIDGAPIASGGQFHGYQADTQYGIANWNAEGGLNDIAPPVGEIGQDGSVRDQVAKFKKDGMEDGGSMLTYAMTHWIENNTRRGEEEIRAPKANIDQTGLRSIAAFKIPAA